MAQHSNSQFVLRNFADTDGRLYFFDQSAPGSRVRKWPPKRLFSQDHLYSTIERNGTRSDDLDKFYQKLETRAAPIAKKIIASARGGRLPCLSAVEKQDWDLFVYNHWRRAPDCFEKFAYDEQALRDTIAEFERECRPLTAEERLYWEQSGTIATFWHNACVDALKKQNLQVLGILNSRGLGIAVIKKPNKGFITGSFPVVKLTNPETPHLGHPSTEAWLALTPDVAVTPAGERSEERVVFVEDDHHIRSLNEALCRQSTVIAGRSKALIASLAGVRA